jgi:hypothetical protein
MQITQSGDKNLWLTGEAPAAEAAIAKDLSIEFSDDMDGAVLLLPPCESVNP